MRGPVSIRLLALATALSGALAAAPAADGRARVPLGPFAGYVWEHAPVTEVSATFTVPRIEAGSPAGSLAATWIGAQGSGASAPFIQIGVNELRGRVPLLRGHRDIYYTFWSDTRLHFHPLLLFLVHPGDKIAASLRRLHHGWRLAIVDATTGASRRFATGDESHGVCDMAEWLQEDVTEALPNQVFPYPHLAGGRFAQLRVDSLTPRRTSLLSQWMSTQRGDIAPTRIRGDGFAFRRGTLGPYAIQYLRIAATFNAAVQVFAQTEQRWTAATPPARVLAASSAYAAAIRVNLRSFVRSHWPARTRAPMRVLARRTRALLALVESAPRRVPRGARAWRAAYGRALLAIRAAAIVVRRSLHAPAY